MAGLVPYRVVRHEIMTKEKIPPSAPQPCDDETQSRQELLQELNTLRLENAYLKKVNALVQTQAKSAQEKFRKS
jgi:transposase